MKRLWLFILFPITLGASLSMSAASPVIEDDEVLRILSVSQDIGYGEYLAGECAACHSMGVAAGSNVPVIHGADAIVIARALLEYRSGSRENTTMRNVASALGDEEIAVLAQYLATQGE